MQEHAEMDSLRLTVDDQIATIVIDRPERKNALTQAMWRELARLMRGIGHDPEIRAVILTGHGADFSAGADIGEFDRVRGTADSARAYEADNSAAFTAIRDCPVPTIAAIRGICFGGGFGLAAACDLRLGATTALFCLPPARLGLAYPIDAMADFVHAVGPQMSKYLAFTAARIDASTALDAGFLIEVVEPGGLDKRALELASTIAANAPLSNRASKASIRASLSMADEDIGAASAIGDATFESEDYAEGRAAFKDRRTPRFTGR